MNPTTETKQSYPRSKGAALTSADEHEDVELLRRVAAHDHTAFASLYRRYAARLGSFLRKLLNRHDLVEDALNDTMLVVWQNAARYDPALARVSTWLFGIAHNKGYKALERLGPRHTQPLHDSEDAQSPPIDLASSLDNPERMAISAQIGQSLTSAMAALSPEHRSVIELAFGQCFGYEEIARVMDCPVNTVKTRMFHARKQLAKLLHQHSVQAPAGKEKSP